MKFLKSLIPGILLGAIATCIIIFYSHRHHHSQEQKLWLAKQAEMLDSIHISSLGQLMNNLFDKIDDELKDNPTRILSDETINRISALSYSFKPYTQYAGDSLVEKKLSPERGHLLLTLSKMNIDTASLQKIFSETDFSGALLRGADLKSSYLRGAHLQEADLKNADLTGAVLSEADLSYANLWGAHLNKSMLYRTVFKRASMPWADLSETQARQANFNSADLTSAQMQHIDAEDGTLIWMNATNATLNGANLNCAELVGVTFTKANLTGAKLTDANLLRADMFDANLTGADLSGSDLSRVGVSEENWLSLLDAWHVRGAKEIQDMFTIVRHPVDHHLRLEKRLNAVKE